MLTLYLLQTLAPLALIAWLAFAPPRTLFGFWIQAGAIGLAFVALGRVGIWAWPPCWALSVFGGLLVFAVIDSDDRYFVRAHRFVVTQQWRQP